MPWVVSVVLFFAGTGTLLSAVLLVPVHGVLGVGYAYLLGSIAHFLGLLCGWHYLFGSSSMSRLLRTVGMPVLLAAIAFALQNAIRGWFAEVTWVGLFALGGLFAGLTALLVFGADWVLGGDSQSKHMLGRIEKSDKFRSLIRCLRAGRA